MNAAKRTWGYENMTHLNICMIIFFVFRYQELSIHYVKSVRIHSYSGPYFPAFGLNMDRYRLSLRIQSECGKIRTIITPNVDTFYAVVAKTSI